MKNTLKYYRNTPNGPTIKGLAPISAQLFRKTDSSTPILSIENSLFTFSDMKRKMANFIGISEYLNQLRKNQIVNRSDISFIIGILSESSKIIGI